MVSRQLLERSTGTYAAVSPLSWTSYEGVWQAGCYEAFSPILPDDYQRCQLSSGDYFAGRCAIDQPLDLSLLLSWPDTVSWFFNADPRPVRTRDDGSPEHNYAPAIGHGEGQRNCWIDDEVLRGIVLEDRATSPSVRGRGSGVLQCRTRWMALRFCGAARWDPTGDGRGSGNPSLQGLIPDSNSDRTSRAGEQTSAASALKFPLAPGEVREFLLQSAGICRSPHLQPVFAICAVTPISSEPMDAMLRHPLSWRPCRTGHIGVIRLTPGRHGAGTQGVAGSSAYGSFQ